MISKSRKIKQRARKIFWATTLACVVALGVALFVKREKSEMLEFGVTSTNSRGVTVDPSFSIQEASVKDTVRKAIQFEMLTIYQYPQEFESKYKSQLANYWVPREQGGEATEDIERAVASLLVRGRHYGKDSVLDNLDFRFCRVLNDTAELQTQEQWFLKVLDKDGAPVPDRDAPNPKQNWRVTYRLKRVNGNWLIHSSDSPYKHKR